MQDNRGQVQKLVWHFFGVFDCKLKHCLHRIVIACCRPVVLSRHEFLVDVLDNRGTNWLQNGSGKIEDPVEVLLRLCPV